MTGERVRIIDPREYRNEALTEIFRPIAQITSDDMLTREIVRAYRKNKPTDDPTLNQWVAAYSTLSRADKIAFGNALSSAARVWVSLGDEYDTVGKLRELSVSDLMGASEFGQLRAQLVWGIFHR